MYFLPSNPLLQQESELVSLCFKKYSAAPTLPSGCSVHLATLPLGTSQFPVDPDAGQDFLKRVFLTITKWVAKQRDRVASLLGAVALLGHRKAACLLTLAFTYCDCKLY